MSRRRERQHAEGEILISTYDNMVAEDGSRKQFCSECGLPRDVAFAKTNPCGACGTTGTQKRPPQFDELGERVPDEVIAERNAARVERLHAARAAKVAAGIAAQAPAKPARQQVAAVKKVAAKAKKSAAVAETAQVSTADMFLMMM